MSKREIIEFIEANPNTSAQCVAKTLCIALRTAQSYRREALGAFRLKSDTESLRLKYALSEIESTPELMEYLSGEMEFNISKRKISRECAREFNVKINTVLHAIECCTDERERKRWRSALKAKFKNGKFVKRVTK